MKLFKGQLNDIRRLKKEGIETVVNENEITYIEGGDIHMISNMGKKSISLHIYSPGNFYG